MRQASVDAPQIDRANEVLTEDALAFLAELQQRFGPRRDELLAARRQRRDSAAATHRLDFLARTSRIREAEWRVPPAPADLQDRRVEITGPTDPKMTINALNSGARVWMADMEDASTPHWHNVIGGQLSLADAIRGSLVHRSEQGKEYRLATDRRLATIVMRPRGWHLDEAHITIDDTPVVGALVDFGLYFFHNAQALLDAGSGPYFYLPKMESHLEARLWREVFAFAEDYCHIATGSVRATALIETIPAAFEMDEILYELGPYASGLNAGRWDYLFSMIKYFRDAGHDFVLPDRNSVTMTAPFMRAYTELLVRTCHRRGAVAMGGMAAFIPSRRDPQINAVALAKVTEDKEREAGQGFDGSWVAHPDLVPICQAAFDRVLGDQPNQLGVLRTDVEVGADDLLAVSSAGGAITLDGLRNNIEVALHYLTSWLGGTGAVAIHNLMEDAATAEISRSQLWQWIHNASALSYGTTITATLVRDEIASEYAKLVAQLGAESGQLAAARDLLEQVSLGSDYVDFLTLPAYAAVVATERSQPR